jgi:hypothetical protein
MLPGPVAFRAAGIRFLGPPAPAGAVRLPHGRPTEPGSDPIGVATLPAREIRPGWCSLYSGGAVPTQPAQALRLPLAASQRPTPGPGRYLHHPRLGITERRQKFTRVHPSGLPRCLWLPGGTGTLGRLLRASHPPLPAAHAEVGTGIGHLPGITSPAPTGPPVNASTHHTDLRVAHLPAHHPRSQPPWPNWPTPRPSTTANPRTCWPTWPASPICEPPAAAATRCRRSWAWRPPRCWQAPGRSPRSPNGPPMRPSRSGPRSAPVAMPPTTGGCRPGHHPPDPCAPGHRRPGTHPEAAEFLVTAKQAHYLLVVKAQPAHAAGALRRPGLAQRAHGRPHPRPRSRPSGAAHPQSGLGPPLRLPPCRPGPAGHSQDPRP